MAAGVEDLPFVVADEVVAGEVFGEAVVGEVAIVAAAEVATIRIIENQKDQWDCRLSTS